MPVGSAYVAHVRRVLNKHTFEEEDRVAEQWKQRAALAAAGLGGDDDLGVGDEEETEDLLSLDPKEWKVRQQ